ncbi:MAG: hypothetical protein ABIR49_04265 [Nitrosospira sp.]
MKSQLPALVMPVSPTSHAVKSLVNRQTGQDLPAISNDVDCVNDANSAFTEDGPCRDSYRNGTGGSRDSISSNRRIYHAEPFVRTKKKRFG